jgi:hypothetical protein
MSPLPEIKPEHKSIMVPFYGDLLNSAHGCIQTAVTSAVVTKNVHVSRCWKAESVAYGSCKQLSSSFMHLRPLKHDRSPVCTVCLESFQHPSWLQNPIATKPYIRKGHMSNQRKAEFTIGNFCI